MGGRSSKMNVSKKKTPPYIILFYIQCSLISEKLLLFGRFPDFIDLSFGKINMQMAVSMEHWWNDTDSGIPKNSEKNLCHFVHYKSKIKIKLNSV